MKEGVPAIEMRRFSLKRFVWLSFAGVIILITTVLCIDRYREPECEGKPLRFWLAKLYDTRPLDFQNPLGGQSYQQAQEALRRMGSAAAPSLATALTKTNSVAERLCLWLAPRLPPILVRQLPPPRNYALIYNRAYVALSALGSNASPAVPQIVRLFTASNPSRQERLAELLGNIGDGARSGVPELIGALEHTNYWLRFSVARALSRIPSGAPQAIPALLKCWRSGRIGAITAAETLDRLGFKTFEAVPELVRILEEGCLASLDHRLGGREAGVVVNTHEDHFGDQINACACLGKIGPGAAAAVPALTKMLTNSESRVRAKAAWALGQMGAEATAATPALARTAMDYWWHVREQAADALGSIGPAAQAAIPDLIRMQNDANRDVRTAASNALRRITTPTRSR